MATRQQRPRGTTTREAVVNAALDVVDRVGVGALTIRAVARRVGAPPMSLYTHFTNKEELIDLMYAEVSRRLYTDGGHDNWQDELAALGQRLRSVLIQHPRWIPLLSRPAEPVHVPVRERLLRMMTQAGNAPSEALRAVHTVCMVAVGLALVELTYREPEGGSGLSKRFDWIKASIERQVATEETAASRKAFLETPRLELGGAFDLALVALVDGVSRRATG